MGSNGSSEHHQNNNLKVVIAYGNFIGKDNSFYDINKKDQVLEFLNTQVKSYDEDSKIQQNYQIYILPIFNF